ncbi:MAG: CopG family transcriptional regulator [Oscillospiraceae bacterium]|nr:CopG family transcriptional regulator [Oscillospiraceae bacterium]MBQ8196351.1 CopG family transcriptional regulator [Oscillospiraceae bacterium]
MDNRITITKRKYLRGEDGHKIFSIRVKEDTVNKLDEIAAATNRSRNELINIMLEFGIENYEIKDNNETDE